jgi:hypothetical protein
MIDLQTLMPPIPGISISINTKSGPSAMAFNTASPLPSSHPLGLCDEVELLLGAYR